MNVFTWSACNKALISIIIGATLPTTRLNTFCLQIPLAEAVMFSLLPMLLIHTVALTGGRDHQVVVINMMIRDSTNLLGVAAGVV